MESRSVKYGVFIAVGLIAYFLLVKLIGMHENPWFRIFNGFIVGYGIFKVIKETKYANGRNFNYFDGFKAGLIAGFIATIVFTLFMAVYIFHLNPEFAERIMETGLDKYSEEPGLLLFVIILEGFASAVILSLLFMQKFKPSNNIKQKDL
ncbi:DUF4199 domain-containing protein [Kordia zhangzhouensis]|uniref:DUF4199 domain-containing protein n=1 Tax=Kordia zhangzhouensis TaxID=1620405 RepID=UPI000629A475|nr:DUF4199 domain-containing protein [Kordia zhangzhouensis]